MLRRSRLGVCLHLLWLGLAGTVFGTAKTLRLLLRSQLIRVRLAQTIALNAPLALLAAGVFRWLHAAVEAATAAAVGTQAARAFLDSPSASKVSALGDAAISVFGLLPYFLAAVILSAVWLGQITAHAAGLGLVVSAGRWGAPQQQLAPLQVLGESVFRAVFMLFLNVFATAADSIGVPCHAGRATALLYTALIAALIAHDGLWAHRGWPVHARFAEAEFRWPYYVGFGLPTALLTFFGPLCVNAAAYNIVLPWLCLTALINPPDSSYNADATKQGGNTLPPLADMDVSIPLLRPFHAAVEATLALMKAVLRYRHGGPTFTRSRP